MTKQLYLMNKTLLLKQQVQIQQDRADEAEENFSGLQVDSEMASEEAKEYQNQRDAARKELSVVKKELKEVDILFIIL